jgi:methyl-accepting chemotaxis protein
MDADARRYRRRRYLVDTRFQLRYVAAAFVAVLIIAVLIEAALVYSGLVSPTEGEYSLLLSLQWSGVGFLLMVAVVLGATCFNIRTTHRVAGPMYRFKESARTVANGDLTHLVKIRRTDDLQDYAELFNGMTAALRERLAEAKRRADELEEALGYVTRLADSCVVERELRDEIAQAEQASRRLATELAFFRTAERGAPHSAEGKET